MNIISHSPDYRPDIDGLRAIAVIAVMAFHAFPEMFPTGFVGVDIFFVISGYLITQILLRQQATGKIDIAVFYARRIRRILPALILVLCTTLFIGWVSLLAEEFRLLAKHTLAGSLFISNFIFLNEVDYFDTAATTKPLIHLWSLSVEEQFYALWPVALIFLGKKPHRQMVACFLTISLLMGAFIANQAEHAASAFYALRYWELLFGCIIAIAKAAYSGGSASLIEAQLFGGNHKWMRLVAPVITGFSFAVIITMSFGGIWIEPPDQWVSVIVTIATTMLIASAPNTFAGRHIIGSRPLIAIGLISFPLYLWHWMLLTFLNITNAGDVDIFETMGVLAISALLSIMTYKFIETPIRFGRFRDRIVMPLCMGLICVCIAASSILFFDGVRNRSVVEMNYSLESGSDGGALGNARIGCGVTDAEMKEHFPNCRRDVRGPARFAVVGDSKAAAIYAGLMRTSSETGRWVFIGDHVPLIAENPADRRPATEIASRTIAANPDIEVVVIVGAARALWNINDGVRNGDFGFYDYNYLLKLSELTQDQIATVVDELGRYVARMTDAGKKVIILRDNPVLPNPYTCTARVTSLAFLNWFVGQKVNEDCFVPVQRFEDRSTRYLEIIYHLERQNPEAVSVFDPTHHYCDLKSGICGPARDNRMLYSYTDHISDYAAGLVGAEMNQRLLRSSD